MAVHDNYRPMLSPKLKQTRVLEDKTILVKLTFLYQKPHTR